MSYGKIIAIGAASAALIWLAIEADDKKKNWENNYQEYKNDLDSFNKIIEGKIKLANEYIDFEEYIQLHYQSFSLANKTKSLLDDVRDSLKAIGQTIMMLKEAKMTIERDILEEKDSTKLNSLKEELKSVKNTRKILFDDQNSLKEQRNSLSEKLNNFNLTTRKLKLFIKNNTGKKGFDWYMRLEARKSRNQENIFISILNHFLKT